ncbi:uncharacterized protein [Euwallacea similis]|uniref:uncharacterized protein n=1 Tax=Euwallacea similis TaxID=1736056 RepID=UPI00345024F0
MRNSLLLILFLVALLLPLANAKSCGRKSIYCLNETTYQTCESRFGEIDYSTEYYTCENGTHCDQDVGNASCLANTTIITTKISTTAEVAASGCGDAGIRCLDDSIYQTCWWFLWWAKYSSKLYSCETGYVCDQNIGCVASTTTTETTVTTVAPEITTPGCGSYTIFCLNETYYQTCYMWLVWPQYSYSSCPDGTVCDQSSSNCTAEVITTTTTTTIAPETSPSDCGSKGIRCIDDSAYQKCWYFLWWVKYDSGYVRCEDGTVCDQENGTTNCVAAA